MSNQASANRYAKALLDVALHQGDPVKAEQDVAAVAELFDRHEEIRRPLTNPVVPVPAKRAVIDEIVRQLRPSAAVARLLQLLAERDRLELLPDLLQAYRQRLMEHQQIVRAEVVSAVPLDGTRAAELQQKLAAITGRTVTLETRVDPSILGGVVARVGTVVYDGSVASQLSKIKARLSENR